MAPENLSERVERAQSEAIELTTVEDEPTPVVLVENDSTDRTPYLAVPEKLLCGCPDNVYRDVICKHLFAIMLDRDSEAGRIARDALQLEIAQQQFAVAEQQQALRELESAADEVTTTTAEMPPEPPCDRREQIDVDLDQLVDGLVQGGAE